MQNIVIIGSGIAGLQTAYLLAQQMQEGVAIHLVERENILGGLLKTFDYGEYGRFDYGAHLFQETGVGEVDSFFKDVLNSEEWLVLADNQREISGCFFHNHIQLHTQFPDLRNFEESIYQEYLSDFVLNLTKQVHKISNQPLPKTALEFSRTYFGNKITEEIIAPILEKTFHKNIAELDLQALYLVPLSRVVIFDELLANDILSTDIFRKPVAYPEQRNLPLSKGSGRASYYPKKFGMQTWIDKLQEKIEQKGIQIHYNTQLLDWQLTNNKINTIGLKKNEINIRIDNIKQVIWSAPMFGLVKLLDIDTQDLRYDAPLKTVLVNILLEKELAMQDLYYLYPYDVGYSTYRITNYVAYCPDAMQDGKYPITLEMLVTEDNLKQNLVELAIKELKSMKLLQDDNQIFFAQAEILAAGFPMPSIKNLNSFSILRSRIQEKNIHNLTTVGVLSSENVFFQKDVMVDTVKKINKLLTKI